MGAKIIIAVLLIFTNQSFSATLESSALNILQKCAAKTNVSEAEFDRPELFLYGPLTERQLCTVKCLMETLKMIDTNGFFRKEIMGNYLKYFDKNIQKEIVSCTNKIQQILSCQDIEKYRECLEPFLKE